MNQPTSPTPSPTRGGDGVPAPGIDDAAGRPAAGDYRNELGSRRWGAAPLRNPEVDRTDPRIAVAAIVILAGLTLIILVVGYASGFWSLPPSSAASGAVAALELLA